MSDYDRDHEPDDAPDAKAFTFAGMFFLALCCAAAIAAPLLLILIYDFLRAL